MLCVTVLYLRKNSVQTGARCPQPVSQCVHADTHPRDHFTAEALLLRYLADNSPLCIFHQYRGAAFPFLFPIFLYFGPFYYIDFFSILSRREGGNNFGTCYNAVKGPHPQITNGNKPANAPRHFFSWRYSHRWRNATAFFVIGRYPTHTAGQAYQASHF